MSSFCIHTSHGLMVWLAQSPFLNCLLAASTPWMTLHREDSPWIVEAGLGRRCRCFWALPCPYLEMPSQAPEEAHPQTPRKRSTLRRKKGLSGPSQKLHQEVKGPPWGPGVPISPEDLCHPPRSHFLRNTGGTLDST